MIRNSDRDAVMQIIIIELESTLRSYHPKKMNNNTLFKINHNTLIKYNQNSTPVSVPTTHIVNIIEN